MWKLKLVFDGCVYDCLFDMYVSECEFVVDENICNLMCLIDFIMLKSVVLCVFCDVMLKFVCDCEFVCKLVNSGCLLVLVVLVDLLFNMLDCGGDVFVCVMWLGVVVVDVLVCV